MNNNGFEWGDAFQMDEFYAAAGLSGVVGQKDKMDILVKLAFCDPDYEAFYPDPESGRIFFEKHKHMNEDFGLILYGHKTEAGEVGDIPLDETMALDSWAVFARSNGPVEVADFFVDRGDFDLEYGFGEEVETGNLFEFFINSKIKYWEYMKNNNGNPYDLDVRAVNISMLASFGTIILPVVKDEHTAQLRQEENRLNRELLEKMRMGDASAEESLIQRADEMAEAVKERIKNEDLLSVFEGYFLSLNEQSGIFSILGDIEGVAYRHNKVTGEKVVKLSLNVTGTRFCLYINEDSLTGAPMEGMRFMGVGLLQGDPVLA